MRKSIKSREFGLLACFALIIVLFGIALYTSDQSSSNAQADANSKHSESYEVEIKKERTFNEILSSDPIASYTRALFWATAILAVFTLILAGVTIFIWNDGKEVAAKQQIASRRALMHAARNALASEKAVEANNKSSERQLRAYVGVSSAQVTERYDQGYAKELTVVVKNFGLTPAYDCRIEIAWSDTRRGFRVLPTDLKGLLGSTFDQPATLMPSAERVVLRYMGDRTYLTSSVVIGRISYVDAFDQPRFTNFRMLSRISTDGFWLDERGNQSS